jgi:type I restriction enzyme S subunit
LAASAAKLLPRNSLLVTTKATIGEVAIADMPVTTNQGFKSLIPSDSADPTFYYYIFKHIASELSRLASGSTFDEISRRDFSGILHFHWRCILLPPRILDYLVVHELAWIIHA